MLFRSLRRYAGTTLSNIPSQQASKGERVVVLGSGWGGFQLVRALLRAHVLLQGKACDRQCLTSSFLHGAGFEHEQGHSADCGFS
jgi:hypothetical protein